MQRFVSKYRVTGQSTFRPVVVELHTLKAGGSLNYILPIVFQSPFITICILANLVRNLRRRYLPSFLETDMHCIEMARTSFIFSVFGCLFWIAY